MWEILAAELCTAVQECDATAAAKPDTAWFMKKNKFR